MMKKRSQGFWLCIMMLVMIVASGVSQATADTLILKPDVEFSVGTPPVSTPPWMTAVFDDSYGDANTVRLTMSADNLTGTEFISRWLFNFSGNVADLGFTYVGGSSTGPAYSALYLGESNNTKADGDGYYDIGFYFPTNDASRFNAGETVVYDISYNSPIAASSFNLFSSEGGGTGVYLTAAHVQGIGSESKSGWVGTTTVVPEPVSSALFVVGAATLGFRRLRKFRKG
jgi:hypothetical protein